MALSVIACDLGTGGVKSAVFGPDGRAVAERVVGIETRYPRPSWHEQRPADWWGAVRDSIRALLAAPGVEPSAVGGLAISGHSLGCVPLDGAGRLLQEEVPIWSDGRAEAEAADFFGRYDEAAWYQLTGNGFPAPLYTLFKAMWLRRHAPDVFARTRTILGTKDYINHRLTGTIATDPSYASGLGAFDIVGGRYAADVLAAAGLDPDLFPPIVPSSAILGPLKPEIAAELGLPAGLKVVAGGVDNSCMALGARTFRDGDIFSSMGSSSWLTIATTELLRDEVVRPYSFAHVVPGLFISATSIFSSGTSLGWVRDQMTPDLAAEARAAGADVHDLLTALAARAPAGAHGLVFVPTLGGGTSLEGGPQLRGAFVGLDLKHDRADVVRATLEGIAMGLRVALDELRRMTRVRGEILVVGGGARSPLWRQIFADAFDCAVVKTAVDQQAAALGAAALALIGLGVWADPTPLDALHEVEDRAEPQAGTRTACGAALRAYRRAAIQQRDLAPDLAALRAASM